MESTQQKSLKILNASAGSGKTYNLVKEYVLLLLDENWQSNKFAQIIAMTFTNKAAFEMKSRIIQALDQLSFRDKYGSKSDQYAIVIGEGLGINPEEVHVRAKAVLQAILHRYEDFHVMTIDKFNLKLIRSFSRDLNLSTDFEIIFNETEVLESIVDKMMGDIDITNKNELARIIFEYAKKNIDDGERWDFRNNLITFSEIIKNEKYKGIVEQLMTADFSSERLKNLKNELEHELEQFQIQANAVYQLFISGSHDGKNLPGGIHTFNALNKLAEITDFPKEQLFTPSFIKYAREETPAKKYFDEALKTACLDLNAYYLQRVERVRVLSIYIRHYFNMALLQKMAQQLTSIRKDEQLIRISEFNTLISQLVKNEDAPFIYERLGTRFQHFLLDEFQDTSHLQWLNMVPLVHESISNQHQNLIVGDPKQSIYRFKNGVAEQFVALPSIYNPENEQVIAQRSAYFEQMGEVQNLADNWRSSSTIVNFNNRFFEAFRSRLSEQNQSFYSSVYQNPKSDKVGYISIISQPKSDSEDALELENSMLLSWIKECEEAGYKRGDICILGEKNKHCNKWAIFLTQQGIDVVSADSLLVNSDQTVQLTIGYLRRRLMPMSENERRKFAEKYFSYQTADNFQAYTSFLKEVTNEKSGKRYIVFDDERFLKTYFKSEERFFEKFENIYDLIQKFYRLMNLDELSNPYLHHLADLAHQFDLNNGPDLKHFLDYYASEGYRSAVQLPESEHAIKIMSIHKSKGLEFPVVLLPNLDLTTGILSYNSFLFQVDDFVLYSNASMKSDVEAIRAFTEVENQLIYTDSMNKCYVALTRPVDRLYILNQFEKDKMGKDIHEILSLVDFHDDSLVKTEEGNGLRITIGHPNHSMEAHTQQADEFFTPENIVDKLWFPDISLKEKELLGDDDLSEAQRYGNQLHLLISRINQVTEIDEVLLDAIKIGEVEAIFMDKLKNDIQAILLHTGYSELLQQADEVISEQSIVVDAFTMIRPDKLVFKSVQQPDLSLFSDEKIPQKAIVIDYKTGSEQKKYVQQMKSYAQALTQIGYQEVEAYLMYTTSKKLVRVI